MRSFLLLAASAMTLSAQPAATRITVGDRVLRHGVKRFGINLGGENFYDSGQLLRNLVARNPGFEGETWQSIVRCKTLTRTGCTVDEATDWPTGFMDGAALEIATGAATGLRGAVRSSARADGGYVLSFASPLTALPGNGSFVILRVQKPGDPAAGWWTDLVCNSRLTAELHDLPMESPSHQALRVDALAPCQRAALLSYFDSLQGHSFVRINGPFTLSFRAKLLAGKAAVRVRVDRQTGATYLDRSIPLQPGWHVYTLPFRAADVPGSTGAVGLAFTVEGSSLLLDDVSLASPAGPQNPTVFRDEVVTTLRDLHPGILRFMDSGTSFGTSLDNWLATPIGRARTGSSTHVSRQEDIGIGLHESLQLAEAVGAEPWISLPAGFSTDEARHLVEYLAGSAQTPYGRARAALGHPAPWDASFATIHLELGNEVWNRGSFDGSTIDDAALYGERAATVFQAMRGAPGFHAARYDLVAGSWAELPAYSAAEAKAVGATADSLAIAPYLFSHFERAPGMEGVYGPMLAEPEQWTRTGGMLAQQAGVAQAAGRRLDVYEVNLGTLSGAPDITQTAINRTVPTVGAALAVADGMLLMLRDLGITDQAFFALSEFANGFSSPGGAGPPRTTPLYGAVVDMGGLTNRRRPSLYALQLVNRAMLPSLLETAADGANPTWDQPGSPNDGIALAHAHLLQSFAFADGGQRSVVLLNLSRTQRLPVTFAGPNAPRGTVLQTTLTAAHIEDSNELAANVAPQTAELQRFDPAVSHWLPPFSLTTYTWKTGVGKP